MAAAQFAGSPKRRFYVGSDLARARTIADLRARTHRRLPRFALEYLECGAEDEATLDRERAVFADWHFVPRTLIDVSDWRSEADILGTHAPLPLGIAPTGLNGVFCRGADIALATGAAAAGVPFVQSTMSNDRIEMSPQSPTCGTGFSSTCSARSACGERSSTARSRPGARR